MGILEGRVALVTGAAHGPRAALGAEFAKALAAAGADIVAADIADASDVAAEITAMAPARAALALRADVSEETQVRNMIDAAIARFGRIDILVNNAAIGSNIPKVPVTELAVEDWDRLMAVNVRGPFLCAKWAVPHMKKQGYGKIINIGSTTSMSGLPNRLHYTSAKGAVHAMTRSLATELGPDGIRVNTLAYGLVTSRLNEAELKNDAERERRLLSSRPLRAHLRAADLCGSLVYLASKDSDHMTGQVMVVDDGELFH
jgi:NAD(P)-dependent dehydrogenase (short-subunit alcohol dehydrogenase family)